MINDILLNSNLDELVINILKIIGINCNNLNNLLGLIIDREKLLDLQLYNEIKIYLPYIKKYLKTTFFTATHKNAEIKQNWPLINLIRQILKIYNYRLIPKRISNGYTKTGIKLYKRIFEIQSIDYELKEVNEESVNNEYDFSNNNINII